MNDFDTSNHRAIVEEFIKRWTGSQIKDSTKAVKDVMCELCARYIPRGREYCGTLIKDGKKYHEWLLDVLWYVKTKKEERGVFLGLESEWQDDVHEVASDFCKLLALKAPVKILLFQSGDKSKVEIGKHLKELNRIGKTWRQHSRGDLIYAINFHDGRHESYFYGVKKAGINSSFSLKSVPDLSGVDRLSA